MSDNQHSNNTNADDNNIVPYETLKASLDAATAEMGNRYTELVEAIHRQDPPLYIAVALHHFNATYAVVNARSSSIISEYGHLAGVTHRIQNQRDDAKRKLESMKKTVNQLKKLNLDDEDANPDDKPNTKNDPDKPNDPNDPNDPKNKGKRRKQ